MNKSNLHKIPSVHRILNDLGDVSSFSHEFLVYHIRNFLHQLREKMLQQDEQVQSINYADLLQQIKVTLQKNELSGIRPALNATGVILHTGLGRAVLPPAAIQAIAQNLSGYCVLEVDCNTGERTVRDIAVKNDLAMLTHAEDATVVNNNAGAILLVLAALTAGKEVIVSRGQLVEIGGSFRIPDIMAQSGTKLIEVGCTNSVRLSDYERAMTNNTAAILHVHTSNFKVCGFCNEVPLEILSPLARKKGIFLLEDAGSGVINPLEQYSLSNDPIIPQSTSWADVVTFSGDKVLGSCQAGLIVGKKPLLEKIRHHPLARALRVDKLTLTVLEATLKLYQQNRYHEIPTWQMITADVNSIRQRAETIAQNLRMFLPQESQITVNLSSAMAGSGSFPTQKIPSYAVYVKSPIPTTELAFLLRTSVPPVFVRVQEDSLVIDPRTLLSGEDQEVVTIFKKIIDDYGKFKR